MLRDLFSLAHGPAMALCSALLLSGCYSWARPIAPSADMLADTRPPEVIVLTRDSLSFHVQHPQVISDSIVGRWGRQRRSVALADVAEVRMLRPNGLLTFLVIGLTPLLVYGLFLLSLPST